MRSAFSSMTCSDREETVLLPVQYQSMPSAEVSKAMRATKGRMRESLSELEPRAVAGAGVTVVEGRGLN